MIAAGLAAGTSIAGLLRGGFAFQRKATPPPQPVDPAAGWQYLTEGEAAAVEAIVDRLIPADSLSIGGREAGCALFIDRQLAGDYGRSVAWYLSGPAARGTPQQGPQTTDTIARRYRTWLAAFDSTCRARHGAAFAALAADRQDAVLAGLETGAFAMPDGVAFFDQILKNTREGFFADPLYGGNKGMAGWKMIGFPGARYDYRGMIARRGADLGLAPVSIYGEGA